VTGAGQRGQTGTYSSIKEHNQMWTSTESGANAHHASLFYDLGNAFIQPHPKTMGYSIRCIKN